MNIPNPRDAQPGRATPMTAEQQERVRRWQQQQAAGAPPGYWQYPPQPGYWQPPPPSGTSGLAIASFVLSIVWLVGIGSVLAIIFAAIALRRIRRSAGYLGGRGLAIAGLVIGIIGTLGFALILILAVAVGYSIHSDLTGYRVPLGNTAHFSVADPSGIRSVTVYSIQYPVGSGAPTGQEFAVADVSVCAGPNGSQAGFGEAGFDLNVEGQTVLPDFSVTPKLPVLPVGTGLAANACERGYLAFEIGTGDVPTDLRYIGSFPTYFWPANSRG